MVSGSNFRAGFVLDMPLQPLPDSGAMKIGIRSILTTLALVCVGPLPTARAVSPAPDGGYPGGNTAEGQAALLNLTIGTYNTAVGLFSLRSNTEGTFNTTIGAGALLANSSNENTASGAGALLSNATGSANTANGAFALFNITTGSGNIALGVGAGISLTAGDNNIDIGNGGVAAESNTIRIGDTGVHQAIFVAGIGGMTPTAPIEAVLVDPDKVPLGRKDPKGLPVHKVLLALRDQRAPKALLAPLDLLDHKARRVLRVPRDSV